MADEVQTIKTEEEVLRVVLERDFAGRKLTDAEFDVLPLKEHILQAIVEYHAQF